MKSKKIFLTLFTLVFLASCSNKNVGNIDTNAGNIKVKEQAIENEQAKSDNLASIDNGKDLSDTTEDKKIDLDDWRNKLVEFGEFDKDFVDSLEDKELESLVNKALKLSEETGYWDVKDFVFQELANDNPGQSDKFPLDSIASIYDWKAVKNDNDTDKYTSERETMIELGYSSDLVYSIKNQDIKDAFNKAYKDNDEAYYMNYVEKAMKYLQEKYPNTDSEDSSEDAYYDKFRQDMVEHYDFDPLVVEQITNEEIDLATQRAEERLRETGFGDIGLIYDELGKMYPNSSSMYPGN